MLNSTPVSGRVHIGIFGRINAGKSSIINAFTNQNTAIVSDVKGTTTDPVSKTMELLPLGPVVIIDTPGLDDTSELGEMRKQKTYRILNKADIALIIIDDQIGITKFDDEIIDRIKEKNIPYIIVYNKCDITHRNILSENEMTVSTKTGENIDKLKEMTAELIKDNKPQFPIICDKVNSGENVVLVIPIDAAAPKGRLILPQQQTIRELLENGCIVTVCREHEIADALASLKSPPKCVITDSQAFAFVKDIVPDDIYLTSFSILFSRHKGNLVSQLKGAAKLDKLKDGDRLLICEGCTHHRQCGDIGTEKLPKMIKAYCKKDIYFEFTSGSDFPEDVSPYSLVIHCGGCMLPEKEMQYRIKCAEDSGIPITNYGMAIAHTNGILKRSLEIFPDMSNLLSEFL